MIFAPTLFLVLRPLYLDCIIRLSVSGKVEKCLDLS
jgi:hypothetical protein